LLAAESNALADARQKLDEKERLLYQIELPRQKLKLQKEIEDAQRQLSLMELFSSNRTFAASAYNVAGIKERSLNPESIQRVREELKVLKENYAILCATNLTILGVDFHTLRAELQRREVEFERHQSQATFRMPFAGHLTIDLPLADGVPEYPVTAGQEIAAIRDLSAVLVRVPLSDAAWTALPPEKLAAIFNLPDGSRLEAGFSFRKVERNHLREESVYYFAFPAEATGAAGRLVGAELACQVWLALTEPARIVPKLSLVLHDPEVFQTRQWQDGVKKISPGAKVLIEGQTDLAVVVPDPKSKL
jgi:hypothetical protein